MTRNRFLARRWPARAAIGLGAAGLALGGIAAAAAGPAQAAPAGPTGHATAGLAGAVATHPISVNTLNWSGNAGFGSRAPAWYKDTSGIVHLQGAATQTSATGSGAGTIGILPPAARPDRDVYTIVHTLDGTYADLAIATNGEINIIGPRAPAVTDFGFVSLEGITYKPGFPALGFPLNTANWSANAGFGSGSQGWWKDKSGVVHLQGAVTQVSNSGPGAGTIGTLPAAAWPKRDVYTIVHTLNGTYADLVIATNGQISIIAPRAPAVTDFGFVSLEGVTYRRSGTTTAIGLNRLNWSGKAGFGSGGPAWFTDKSGVVHLQGAVTQTSSVGAAASTIGTLPAAARPGHDVYTIVHTFNGTYADLVIATNGQISIIAPRAPMVTDYTFVSLEGISYLR
jgi:hypothetical protein